MLPNQTLVVAASPRGVNQIRQVATNQHDADLRHLLEISWLVLAVTTLGAAVLGWFAAGRLLAPLRSITATARTISAGSLDQRLALAGPDDEFKQLGDTLDDLFGRLEASFDAQRRFVANASHELRTPLTVERTLLQVALSDPNATQASLRATCEELLTSQTEHAHLLESLLTLATSERGLERREPLDLSVLASDTLHEFGAAIAGRELRVVADLEAAPTVGDPALLARLVANLVDNAVEYNVDRGDDRDPYDRRRGAGAAYRQQHGGADPGGRHGTAVGAVPEAQFAARRRQRPPRSRALDCAGDRHRAQRGADRHAPRRRRARGHRPLRRASSLNADAVTLVVSPGPRASVW